MLPQARYLHPIQFFTPGAALMLWFQVSLANEDTETFWDVLEANKGNTTALNQLVAPPWVDEPDRRGTFSILLSCTLTLVACVYSALHLNIPEKTDWWSVLKKKVEWALIALVAPELVVCVALYQLVAAWRLKVRLCTYQEGKEKTVSLRYAFFIIMGGLQVEVSALGDRETLKSRLADQEFDLALILQTSSLPTTRHKILKTPIWSSYFRSLGLFTDDYDPTGHKLHLTSWAVTQLSLDFWDDVVIADAKIEDKSKANSIQKTLVLVQLSWMVAVCIARKASGLPLSLLEIHCMVHVVCAIAIFMLWLKKPLDILDPEVKTCSDTARWGKQFEEMVARSLTDLWCSLRTGQSFSRAANFGPEHSITSNDRLIWFKSSFMLFPTGVVGRLGFIDWRLIVSTPMLLGAAYGGIHLSAWNSAFPTEIESLLWKVSCGSIVVTGPLLLLLGILWYRRFCWPIVSMYNSRCSRYLFRLLLVILCAISMASRIFVIIESFISLRRSQAGVYWVPAWLQTIPHV